MEYWSTWNDGTDLDPRVSSSAPVLPVTPIVTEEYPWLILNTSHVQSATTSLWRAKNFFVCRKPTVIVRTAATNFRSVSLPTRQIEINAPAGRRHDATQNQIPPQSSFFNEPVLQLSFRAEGEKSLFRI